MEIQRIVSRDEWLEARRQLLAQEKDFTRQRDELSRQRRALPWVRIDKAYAFDGPNGRETLPALFDGRHQLVVYHFMFSPDWETGCKSCSFWADNFDGIVAHLNQRDVTFVAISRAPLPKLQAFATRMGWRFKWMSSSPCDFNFDFQVSFTPQDLAGEVTYNFAMHKTSMSDLPGISVFYKDAEGTVFHTYSCYARGLDMLNAAYQVLDLVPKGRDEADLPYPMAWVQLRDQYGT
jgi:predicted dithiol-disulfide oxidoreductase (DUF899 family)